MKNNKNITYIFIIVSFIVFSLWSFSGTAISADTSGKKQEVKKDVHEQTNPYANAKISIKIIPSIDKTYGYDIFINGKRLVHQPHIPAVAGNRGFTTKARAQKVAEFVVKKIRKNEMPPTVTIDNLKNLGVLK